MERLVDGMMAGSLANDEVREGDIPNSVATDSSSEEAVVSESEECTEAFSASSKSFCGYSAG